MPWPQPAPPEYYEWMVTGAEPPLGLSLWIYRAADRQPGEQRPGNERRLVLPTVHVDGGTIRFECHEITLHGLTISLALHPGWPIDHPLETDGRAVRLWPRPEARSLRLATLPPVPLSQSIAWSRGWEVFLAPGAPGAPGALGSHRLPR